MEQQREHFRCGILALDEDIRAIQLDLKNIQILEDQDLAVAEPKDTKAEHKRKTEGMLRHMMRAVKQEELSRNQLKLQIWGNQLTTLVDKIADEKTKMDRETWRQSPREEMRGKAEEDAVPTARAEKGRKAEQRDFRRAQRSEATPSGHQSQACQVNEARGFHPVNNTAGGFHATSEAVNPAVAPKRSRNKGHEARKAAWKARFKHEEHEARLRQEDHEWKLRVESNAEELAKVARQHFCSHDGHWNLVADLHMIGFCKHCRLANRRGLCECPICAVRACHHCCEQLKHIGSDEQAGPEISDTKTV